MSKQDARAQRLAGIHCPVDATIHLIGGKYKALLLWHLLDGPLRYGELSRLVDQATPKMLTQQLRELEHDGLLIRTAYPEVPPRVDYALTPRGHSLKPLLQAMYAWGHDFMQGEGLKIACNMKAPL